MRRLAACLVLLVFGARAVLAKEAPGRRAGRKHAARRSARTRPAPKAADPDLATDDGPGAPRGRESDHDGIPGRLDEDVERLIEDGD